ncbi:hypothetical protein BHM03_00039867, partial [Ensete ventricosum]
WELTEVLPRVEEVSMDTVTGRGRGRRGLSRRGRATVVGGSEEEEANDNGSGEAGGSQRGRMGRHGQPMIEAIIGQRIKKDNLSYRERSSDTMLK